MKKQTKRQIDALAKQFHRAAYSELLEFDREEQCNPKLKLRLWGDTGERQRQGFRAIAQFHLKLKGEK